MKKFVIGASIASFTLLGMTTILAAGISLTVGDIWREWLEAENGRKSLTRLAEATNVIKLEKD